MGACKTLVLTSLSRLEANARKHFSLPFSTLSLPRPTGFYIPHIFFSFLLSPTPGLRAELCKACSSRCYSTINEAIVFENADSTVEANPFSEDIKLDILEGLCKETVEELLSKGDDDVSRFMKMERTLEDLQGRERWFPYLDKFKAGTVCI